MPDGKPANEFAFNAEPKNKEFAENIIAGERKTIWKVGLLELFSSFTFAGTNESWKKLISGDIDGNGIVLTNTALNNGESVDAGNATSIVAQVVFKVEP